MLVEREDRFPFKRVNAQCNCEECQAKTIYDSNDKRLSSCQPQYTLMPVLFRESIVKNKEKWIFKLEEISVSCVCSILLNPFF